MFVGAHYSKHPESINYVTPASLQMLKLTQLLHYTFLRYYVGIATHFTDTIDISICSY